MTGEVLEHMWPDFGKNPLYEICAMHAMRVFSNSGQKLSKLRFCHSCQKTFLLLPSSTEAKRKLLRRNKPFFYRLLDLFSPYSCRVWRPLLRVIIKRVGYLDTARFVELLTLTHLLSFLGIKEAAHYHCRISTVARSLHSFHTALPKSI